MSFTYENVMSFVYFLGSVQGIILSVLLFSSTKNVLANRLMGILTFMWAIALFAFGLSLQGIIAEYPHLLRTVSHVEFTLFPLLFLNVNYLLKKHEKFRRKDLLHFIPFIFIILMFIPFYRETAETKYILVSTNSGYYYYLNIISDEILSLQGIIYSILALIMIRKYNRSIVDYESNIDKVLLKYYRLGIYVLLAAWIFGTVAVNLNLMYIEVNFNLFIFTYLLIVFVIYMASYAAIKSDEIYKLSDEQILHSSNLSNIDLISIQRKDDSNKLDSKLEKLNNQLLIYMDEHLPYLNAELAIQDLASSIGVSRNQLSETINIIHKMNFHEFINSYRVENVKRQLKGQEKKHYKLISIAFDSGFNSKASFNRIFKQHTQQTPSQFLLSLNTN
jgi:AraC-like DNA-binding protein